MKRGYWILDDDNRPLEVAGVIEWGRWFFVTANRIVGFTEVTTQVRVSTVFLGIDHRYFGGGPPILFETMIFGGPLDQSQWRYASWDDAEAGHRAAVRKTREAAGQKISEQVR